MQHVVQISFFNDPLGRSAAELLDTWSTLVDVAEAASRAGVRVSVVQASSHIEQLTRNNVHYYFLPFADLRAPNGQSVAYVELLRSLAPDVFHVHGLDFPQEVLALAKLSSGAPSSGAPII